MIQSPKIPSKGKMKPLPKILLLVLAGSALLFALVKFDVIPTSSAPSGSSGGGSLFSSSSSKDDDVVDVSVNTWPGFIGGQYFNEGFAPSEQSRYQKEYGVKVNFNKNDDIPAGRQAFLSGDIDVLWATVDALPSEINGLKSVNPKVFFQSDWSRGGDAIVAKRGIRSVKDLAGKTVACAFQTPSHSLLLSMLDANNMTMKDITLVKVESGIAAAQQFKAGAVDAAVVWSPDDKDCIDKIPGSSVLISSRQATHIITDVFLAREEYIKSHKKELVALVKGWMQGAAEINSDAQARTKAVRIMATGLGMDEPSAAGALSTVRLTTFGDNKQFFGNLSSGKRARDVYERSIKLYHQSGDLTEEVPDWSDIFDGSIIAEVELPTTGSHAPEGTTKFVTVSAQPAPEKVFSNKSLTIEFPTGESSLTEDYKELIRNEFLPIAKDFSSMRIRIVGNTDNVGPAAVNKSLSNARAKAVADFIQKEGGYGASRFFVSGVGPANPVADNTTEEGRARNRRTDLQLIRED